MDNKEFKATHQVVKLELGSFVFAVGTLLRLADKSTPNYFVDDQGNRKYVPNAYVKTLDAITIEEQASEIQKLRVALDCIVALEKQSTERYLPIQQENETLKAENAKLSARNSLLEDAFMHMRDAAKMVLGMEEEK